MTRFTDKGFPIAGFDRPECGVVEGIYFYQPDNTAAMCGQQPHMRALVRLSTGDQVDVHYGQYLKQYAENEVSNV